MSLFFHIPSKARDPYSQPSGSGRVGLRRRFASRDVLRKALGTLAVSFLMVFVLGASDSNARFNNLGHRMMCTCGCNQILLECNHVGCTVSDSMRAELTAALDKGDNDDLVLQSFVQKYGATVLAAPTKSGFNVVAWIMPFAVLGVATWTAVFFVRRWAGAPSPAQQRVEARMAELPLAEAELLRRRARQETQL